MSEIDSLPQWLKEYQRAYPTKISLQTQIETETNLVKEIGELKSQIEKLNNEISKLKTYG